ncbi:Probable cadmium/zinc-transporting ATPase HMA1, chloroplastic [Chlamydiales bacterium SCGC AG-110-M15]|nr:Probable cadmium/zinc-transporting ATPase HMA1, chloroplastic [Chlamydiales bacterium SCGC AG-110-M15]
MAHSHNLDLPPHPYLFDEFIASGFEDSSSPFLTKRSRRWGDDLALKSSILAAILLTISFILSFFPTYLPISNIALIIVYFLAGIPSLIDSVEDIICLEINIDVLMTLAAFLSVIIGSGMEGGLLLVLFAISGSMEESVTSKAKSTLQHLHRLSPTKACVIDDDGKVLDKSIRDIQPGTKILIKAGEIVPLDGDVIEGRSSVNLVHLTGENFPVVKGVGDELPAGARNLDGRLIITVTKPSSESTLSHIIKLITQAQEAKPRLQRFLSNASKTYSTSIILLTFLFSITMPFFLSIPYFGHGGSVYRSLAFLIAASPCALIIAIPIAYLSAISICARNGILLKGGVVLDGLTSCSAIAFDKTGTLTTGDLSCTLIEPLKSWPSPSTENQHLSLALALENNAVHPIAKAITQYAKEQNIKACKIDKFRSIPGYGLEATTLINGQTVEVSIGHPDFIAKKINASDKENLHEQVRIAQAKGELLTILLVGNDITLIHFRDTIRPSIRETLDTLQHEQKMRVLLLSGDHKASVENIAKISGIKDFYADLRPEDKLNYVTEIANKQGLAMVGDGVNDAPALARATIGISMGKVGSATTIDVSDVVLLHDNIELLPWLMRKAQSTRSIVKQNVTIAASAIIFASLAALGGIVPLWLAVILHEGGTVLVGLNSLRLLKK